MSNFEEVKEIGNQYYKDGDFNSALEKYNECLIHYNNVDKDSKDLRYKILSNQAACYLKLSEYSKVIQLCTEILEESPDNIKALFRRASAQHAIKNYDAAAVDLKFLLHLDKSNTSAIKALEKVLRDSNEKSNAERLNWGHDVYEAIDMVFRDEELFIGERRARCKIMFIQKMKELTQKCCDDSTLCVRMMFTTSPSISGFELILHLLQHFSRKNLYYFGFSENYSDTMVQEYFACAHELGEVVKYPPHLKNLSLFSLSDETIRYPGDHTGPSDDECTLQILETLITCFAHNEFVEKSISYCGSLDSQEKCNPPIIDADKLHWTPVTNFIQFLAQDGKYSIATLGLRNCLQIFRHTNFNLQVSESIESGCEHAFNAFCNCLSECFHTTLSLHDSVTKSNAEVNFFVSNMVNILAAFTAHSIDFLENEIPLLSSDVAKFDFEYHQTKKDLKNTNFRTETMDARKSRLEIERKLTLRTSMCNEIVTDHDMWYYLVMHMLISDYGTSQRLGVVFSRLVGAALKKLSFTEDDENMQKLAPLTEKIRELIRNVQDKLNNKIEYSQVRAFIEISLFTASQKLGSQIFATKGETPEHFITLLHHSDQVEEDLTRIAAELFCVASTSLEAHGTLDTIVKEKHIDLLLGSQSVGVRVAAASGMLKLAIRSKSLHPKNFGTGEIELLEISKAALELLVEPSSDDGINTFTANIRDSPHEFNLILERSLEIVAAITVSSKMKNLFSSLDDTAAITGSTRFCVLLNEIPLEKIIGRPQAAYAIGHILFMTTTTSDDLRRIALREKGITEEEYQNMKKLQSLPSSHTVGEQTNVDLSDLEDDDTYDNCDKRVKSLCADGALKLLAGMLLGKSTKESKKNNLSNSFPLSYETALLCCKALRQICSVVGIRGYAVQNGVIKACLSVAGLSDKKPTNSESLVKSYELVCTLKREAIHTIAKILVTTNPQVLSDHLRVSSMTSLLWLARDVDASNLQQFECLLSMTNLLSCGEYEQTCFLQDKGIQTVYYLILSEHSAVRRAATEVFCNISATKEVKEFLCYQEHCKLWVSLCEELFLEEKEKNENEDAVQCLKRPINKNSHEYLTAKAAAGCIAVAICDAKVIKSFSNQKHFFDILSEMLTSSDLELIHRSVVIIRNLLQHYNLDNKKHKEYISRMAKAGVVQAVADAAQTAKDGVNQVILEIIATISELLFSWSDLIE